jgi:hypothetical protein
VWRGLAGLSYIEVPLRALDCWPRELVWHCPQCKGIQQAAARICSTCSAGERTRASALHQLLLSLSHAPSMQCPQTPHAPSLFLEMDDLVGILLSPHGNRMSGLTVDAYKIEAARSCICMEREEGKATALSIDYNSNSIPSYFNLHPQQAKVRRSERQVTVAGALGGASQQEETEESHVLAKSDGEDMAISDMAPGNRVSTGRMNSRAAASTFGIDFNLVELATDSSIESVAEVGGPGLGFNVNRTTVTTQPGFPALDVCDRV